MWLKGLNSSVDSQPNITLTEPPTILFSYHTRIFLFMWLTGSTITTNPPVVRVKWAWSSDTCVLSPLSSGGQKSLQTGRWVRAICKFIHIGRSGGMVRDINMALESFFCSSWQTESVQWDGQPTPSEMSNQPRVRWATNPVAMQLTCSFVPRPRPSPLILWFPGPAHLP